MPGSSTPPASYGSRPSVALIGGGVMGLSIGWRLAAAGCRVDVFERGSLGHGASWAAAGMLAAGVETEPGEQDLLRLNRRSQEMWPGFAAELEAASGIDVELRQEGTLVVALNRDDAERLRFCCEFQRSVGIELSWIGGTEARRREPHLNPAVVAAAYSPNDGQVDNRRLVEALMAACRSAGVRLHENAEVSTVDIEHGRVTGLRVGEDRHAADVVVLAAGAWARTIAGLPDEARPPVRPIKGQLLALQMDPNAPLLTHVVWSPRVYLVPRRGGRLVVGATVEERGFDGAMTAGGVFALLEGAWRAVPALEELPIGEMWVGFRPGSPDDAPMLGPSPVEGLVLATGHHRNGILLTPVTAETISRFILTGELADAIRPFGLDRFTRPAPSAPLAASASTLRWAPP